MGVESFLPIFWILKASKEIKKGTDNKFSNIINAKNKLEAFGMSDFAGFFMFLMFLALVIYIGLSIYAIILVNKTHASSPQWLYILHIILAIIGGPVYLMFAVIENKSK